MTARDTRQHAAAPCVVQVARDNGVVHAGPDASALHGLRRNTSYKWCQGMVVVLVRTGTGSTSQVLMLPLVLLYFECADTACAALNPSCTVRRI